jgi:hypothetical protein
MSAVAERARADLERFRTGWNTFWFRPEPTSTIAVVRIVFGAVATLWTLSQLPVLLTFYGEDGVLPTGPALGVGAWTLLGISSSAPVVIGLWVVTLLGAIGVMIGFRTRLATVLLFVGVLSFERRDPYVLNAGDLLLRTLAFYFIFSPAGQALSLDRWRRDRDRFWEFPPGPTWTLRLMQIQLSVIYFATLWGKLQGDTWRTGTAVSYALRIDDIHRFPTPTFLTDSVVLSEAMTFSTLLLEGALAVLIWSRRLRPWVLALGVLLHVTIGLSIMVGFFTLLMLTTYLAFLPPETARTLVLSARDRWRRRRAGRRSRTSPPSVHHRGATPERTRETGAGARVGIRELAAGTDGRRRDRT